MANRSKWLVIGVGVIVLGLMLWGFTEYFLARAIHDLNREVDGTVTADQIIKTSLQDNASRLAQITQADAVLFLPHDQLSSTIKGALDLASQAAKLPVSISDVQVQTDQQVINFSATVVGQDKASHVKLKARIEGAVTIRFQDRDLLVRPAARKITLESLKIPRWNWFPSSIVRIANPLVSRVLTTLNGETKDVPISVLPKPSKAEKVKVGSEEITIPELSPKAPAVIIDSSGIYVVAQFIGATGTEDPASSFELFKKSFFAKIAKRFSMSPKFQSGFTLADDLVNQVLGPLRAPASVDALTKQTVFQNAKALTEMRGPDVVVRISANETKDLIGSFLVSAVAKLRNDSYSIEQPQLTLDEGLISVVARLATTTKYGNGQVARGSWDLAIAAIPSAENNGRALSLTPRVQKVVLKDITVSGGAPDFAFLLPALNAALENLTKEVNRVIPRIPIKLPSVTPEEVKIDPIKAAGISATVLPEKFVPLRVGLSRALVATSSSGIWILADIDPIESLPAILPVIGSNEKASPVSTDTTNVVIADLPKQSTLGFLPPRPPIGSGIIDPASATAQSLDIAIDKLVRSRYGDFPAVPLFAETSWRRFATLFNAQWQRLGPHASIEFDTGTIAMETQRINLTDYARFECKRTRECQRNACEQRSCSFRGCSRADCGGSCPEVESKSCAFGRCVVWYRGPDLGCEAGKLACNTKAEADVAACNVTANAEKAVCDASAVAEKAGCDIREEAAKVDCNRLAEQEVGFCEIKKLLTNGLAEVSGVGAIGGDARARGKLSLDLAYLLLNEEQPEVAFLPIIDGEIRGDLAIDWTPYDVLGNVFVCPVRGKVFANSAGTFNRSQPKVVASLFVPLSLNAGATQSGNSPAINPASIPAPPPLTVKVSAFNVPMAVEPGILNSLYRNNPQIAVTCPVASGLLGIPGLVIGNSFRAISEDDLGRLLASTAISPGPATTVAPLLYAMGGDNVKAGMGALFGGKFNVPINEITQEIKFSNKEMELPGGTIIFTPQLDSKAFKLSVRAVLKPSSENEAVVAR